MTQLYIKNMVCNRCIHVVTQLFKEAGLPALSVKMGEVQLAHAPDETQQEKIQRELQALGFEILGDQKNRLIEKIKNIIIGQIQQGDGRGGMGEGEGTAKAPVLSALLASSLYKDYSYLSKLFSEVEGLTIEKYVIQQKIEKVKEWLAYDELSLGEMADRLGYSSVAHLSAQFSKTTGLTPSVFRKLKDHHRRSLDQVGGRII